MYTFLIPLALHCNSGWVTIFTNLRTENGADTPAAALCDGSEWPHPLPHHQHSGWVLQHPCARLSQSRPTQPSRATAARIPTQPPTPWPRGSSLKTWPWAKVYQPTQTSFSGTHAQVENPQHVQGAENSRDSDADPTLPGRHRPCVGSSRQPGLPCFVIVVQSLSWVRLFATPWTAACQASLSFTIS